jgi:nucleoside-diphosphate kinase
MTEQTLVIIKPDAFEKNQQLGILSMFCNAGLNMVKLQALKPDREMVERHYEEHKDKDFFSELVEFMLSGKVCVAILEGEDAVARARTLLGPTDPEKWAPTTVRGKYGTDRRHNACHASDSVESAKREIGIWFKDAE